MMNHIARRNLVVSLPVDMYSDYKECSAEMGQNLSEMTRKMIAALISGNLRIKRDMLKYDRQIELERNLYGAD